MDSKRCQEDSDEQKTSQNLVERFNAAKCFPHAVDYGAKNSAEVVQNTLNLLQSSLSWDASYDNDTIDKLGNNGITALVIVLIVCDVFAVLMGFALTRMVVKPLKLVKIA